MAPRRRPKKVGLRRIDAAIDALTPLGFSRELVRKTVDDLLKVYEGDGGWVFIEEASYKILIETILNNQEEERAQEESKAQNDESTAEHCEAGDIDSHHDELSDTQQVGGSFDCEDISCMDGLRHGLDGQGQPSLTSHEVDQPSGRPRQRAPCFGWLSESEEENESEELEDKSEIEEPPGDAYIVCQDQEGVLSTGSLHHEMKREPPSNASFKQEVVGFAGSPHHEMKHEPPSNASIIYQEQKSVEFSESLYHEINQKPSSNASIINQEQERVGFAGSLHHKRKRRSGWDVKPSDM